MNEIKGKFLQTYKKIYDKGKTIFNGIKIECLIQEFIIIKMYLFSLSSVLYWAKLLSENVERQRPSKRNSRSSILIKYGNRRKQNG